MLNAAVGIPAAAFVFICLQFTVYSLVYCLRGSLFFNIKL